MRRIFFCVLVVLIMSFLLLPTHAAAAREGNYTYTVTNGEATITKFTNNTEDKVVIPSTLGGYPVTCIGQYAFMYKMMSHIVIPDSVTTIESNAFYVSSSLREITIPKSVTSICTDAFAYCSNLKRYIVDPQNPCYSCDELGVLYNKDKTVLLSIPAGLNFNGSYTIPDNVTTIGDYAFGDSEGLTSITIPKNVTSIGKGAFLRCSSLTNLRVDEANEYYSSNDEGVLFSKDRCTLIAMPGDVEGLYTIPDCVTTIGDYAFARCRLFAVSIPDSVVAIGDYAFYNCHFDGITIPHGVKQIGEGAFNNCSALARIAIPNSITSMGDSVFTECTALKTIYYSGSKAQWASLIANTTTTVSSTVYIHYSYFVTPSNCAHSYSRYLVLSDTQHTRVCALCATEEISDHHWRVHYKTSVSYTKDGIAEYVCRQCNTTKTETITKNISEFTIIIGIIVLIGVCVFVWRVKKLH